MAAKKRVEAVATIPRRADVDEFVQAIEKDAKKSLALIEQLEIQKPADREFASNALSEIAKRHDVFEAKRLSWVGPLKAVTADIDATFRPATKALKRAIEVLKFKIGQWDVAQAHARSVLLRQSVAQAQLGNEREAAKAFAKAEDHAPSDSGAASTIVWTGQVEDEAKIPREYLVPDIAKLEALTAALGRDPQIPGWRAFQTAKVRTSRKGVA